MVAAGRGRVPGVSECSGINCPCQPAYKVGKCEGENCGKTFNKEELEAYRFGHYNLPDKSQEPIVLWLCRKCLEKIKARNGEQTTVVKEKKIGRNDPCPCGSGKKYKKCCI